MIPEILFWLFILISLYSYIGYGILIVILNKLAVYKWKFLHPSNSIINKNEPGIPYIPKVTLIISAFAENREIIKEKIKNTLALNYPGDKLEVFFAVAVDGKSQNDETFDQYLRHFLNLRISTGLNSKTEELFARFSFLDAKDPVNQHTLHTITELLQGFTFTSDDITPDYKNVLNNYREGFSKELQSNWFITKDIERKGKISQVNRTVKKATGEIIVFSDANALFNADSIANLVRHFSDTSVACVAGEKRIKKNQTATGGEGEGLYWKYESFLKRQDSKLYSTMGAAGEIYAVRKDLMNAVEYQDAVIEDFVMSMKFVEQGYKIIYEPDAYAEEDPSINIKEEFKRRKRISAGGFQAIGMLSKLLNIFKYRLASFQFISHRVLRWAVVPFLLPLIFITNLFILNHWVYYALLAFQIVFYLSAFIGYRFEAAGKKKKPFNIIFAFIMMNYSAYPGLYNYFAGKQSVLWEKASRAESKPSKNS